MKKSIYLLLCISTILIDSTLSAQSKPAIQVIFTVEKGTYFYTSFSKDIDKIEKEGTIKLLAALNRYIGYLNFKASADTSVLEVILRRNDPSNPTNCVAYILHFNFSAPYTEEEHTYWIDLLSLTEFGQLVKWEEVVKKIEVKVPLHLKGLHRAFAEKLFSEVVLCKNPLFLKPEKEWVLPFHETDLPFNAKKTFFKIYLEGNLLNGPGKETIELAIYQGPYEHKNPVDKKYLHCMRISEAKKPLNNFTRFTKKYVYIKTYGWREKDENINSPFKQ